MMRKSFLSYVELKKQAKNDIESERNVEKGEFNISPADEENLSGFFGEIESIKTQIEEINHLLHDLHNLNEETKSTHSAKILRGLRDRMESNTVAISRKANAVKTLIEAIEKSNAVNRESFKEGSCVDRTRVSITNDVRAKLGETMSEFHRLRERIFADYRDDSKRKYVLATGEEPSNEEMEKMISADTGFEVKPEMDLKMKERLDAANDIKRSLEAKIETQGDGTDDIEANVATAGSFVSGGTNGLFKEGSCVDRTRVSITNGVRAKLRETMSEFHRLRERIFADYRDDSKRKYYLAFGEEPSNEEIEMKEMISADTGFELKPEMDLKTKERLDAVNDIKRSLEAKIETQGDLTDDSEANVATAGSFVSGGTNGLFYADQMKKKNLVVWGSILGVIFLLLITVDRNLVDFFSSPNVLEY